MAAVKVEPEGSVAQRRSVAEQAALALVSRLAPREVDVLRLTGYGRDITDVAKSLSLSTLTIKHYLCQMRQKLGVRTQGDMVRLAIRSGLSSLWVELDDGPESMKVKSITMNPDEIERDRKRHKEKK